MASKRKRRSPLTGILLVLVILLSAFAGALIYTEIKAAQEPVYTYVSMSGEAAGKAQDFLSEISDTGMTFASIKECMGDFNMEIVVTPVKETGTYTRKLAEGSYEYCESQARVGLERAYKQAVMNRLIASGYQGDVSGDLVDRLMQTAYGMTVEEYLKKVGAEAFPTKQEIISMYCGETDENPVAKGKNKADGSILDNLVSVARAADLETPVNYTVIVDGQQKCIIKAFEMNYENNLYVSLKGIAAALAGTEKAFYPRFTKDGIEITTGMNYAESVGPWAEDAFEEPPRYKAKRNALTVDEKDRKYYSILADTDNGTDAFFTPLSMSLMLGLQMDVEDKRITIVSDADFTSDPQELTESGYLQGINSYLVGDGSTGEVYFAYDEDEVVPIASTTKLMTYYVAMDAVKAGKISMQDMVTVSENAETLSKGIDGVIELEAGSTVPMTELMQGMLLASSNECALVIAEHVAGSEEAFVQRMNQRAMSLGLSGTEFYNCNGLPVYDDQFLPAKKQNHMTASEMFTLASELLKDYPEVLNITSVRETLLEILHRKVGNTNAVLFNVDEVKGLKTGTTNKAGACLVTCAPKEVNGQTHYLLSVLLGAEGEEDRASVSEIGIRYALQEVEKRDTKVEEIPEALPDDPELVVRRLLQCAFR